MDLQSLLSNQYALAVLGFVAGIVSTIITAQIMGRRSVFTYFVSHSRVGMSANDQVFGTVQVTWNNNPIAHLYYSTVELTNQSFKDFQDVGVTIYTSDTKLLSQHTAVLDTPHIVLLSPAYLAQIQVPQGQQPTASQFDTWNRRREYTVPVFNRGATLRFTFLNAADSDKQPSIWLNVTHPGVKVRFHAAVERIWGVPKPRAALAGVLMGVALLTVLQTQVSEPWIIASASFVYGLVVTCWLSSDQRLVGDGLAWDWL